MHHLNLRIWKCRGNDGLYYDGDNYQQCTKIQIEAAAKACQLQEMIGSQSQKEFERVVCGNMITNCPSSIKDIINAHKTLRPNHAGFKGKLVKKLTTSL